MGTHLETLFGLWRAYPDGWAIKNLIVEWIGIDISRLPCQQAEMMRRRLAEAGFPNNSAVSGCGAARLKWRTTVATRPLDQRVRRRTTENDMGKRMADDMLIWSLNAGTTLQAKKDMFMEDDEEHVFTQGKRYYVESMHPIAEPAYVVVKNDHSERHRFYADHIREYFVTPSVV